MDDWSGCLHNQKVGECLVPEESTMASANIQQIDTNTPDMDYLLEIYGMSAATQVRNLRTV